MPSVSYQLRGTSGSGKTTVTRALMDMSGAEPHEHDPSRPAKPISYLGKLWDHPIIFLGSYKNTNGGCDTIRHVEMTARLLSLYMDFYDKQDGIVFFEGLMISHMLGTVGRMQMTTGIDRHVLAFLDTPLEVCLNRIVARRKEAGNLKPFNPANTTKDHPRVFSSASNALRQGYVVTLVDHTNAVEAVLKQLSEHVRGIPITDKLSPMDQREVLDPFLERPRGNPALDQRQYPTAV